MVPVCLGVLPSSKQRVTPRRDLGCENAPASNLRSRQLPPLFWYRIQFQFSRPRLAPDTKCSQSLTCCFGLKVLTKYRQW